MAMMFWTKQEDGTFECLQGPDKLVVRPQRDGTFTAEIVTDSRGLKPVEGGPFKSSYTAMGAAEDMWAEILKRAEDP